MRVCLSFSFCDNSIDRGEEDVFISGAARPSIITLSSLERSKSSISSDATAAGRLVPPKKSAVATKAAKTPHENDLGGRDDGD